MRILFLLILFPFTSFAQQTLYWSDTITVNDDNSMGYARPRITMANEIPVVVWGKSNDQGVYSSRLNGSSFSPVLQLNPPGMNTFVRSWAGPSVASSGDTVFVAMKAQPEDQGLMYLVRSTDGGITFGDTLRVSDENWTRFPEVAVAPGGNPTVAFMAFDPNFQMPRWNTVVSTNGGLTFSQPSAANTNVPGEACDCCPGSVLADGNNTIVMFRNNDNNLRDLWLSRSTDNAATFPQTADVDTNNWMVSMCPSSGPDGIIHGDSITVVWMSGGSGSNKSNFATVNINDFSVGTYADFIPGSGSSQNYPRIAGSGDTLGVVWQENRNGSIEIVFIYSVTGPAGLKTSPITVVNLATDYTQQNPDIAYHNGKFHIVWQDSYQTSVIYRSASFSNTGVAETGKGNFSMCPNPASGFVRVECEEPASGCVVRDIRGRIVKSEVLDNKNFNLDVSDLTPGIYMVEIGTTGGAYSKKLVVQ